eukprot:Pgem_evm1s10778
MTIPTTTNTSSFDENSSKLSVHQKFRRAYLNKNIDDILEVLDDHIVYTPHNSSLPINNKTEVEKEILKNFDFSVSDYCEPCLSTFNENDVTTKTMICFSIDGEKQQFQELVKVNEAGLIREVLRIFVE